MSSDGALFDDEQAHPTGQGADSDIADWQVAQLRRALDERGLTNMADRRVLIEKLAGRAASSLRDLSSAEARVVVERLSAENATSPRTTKSSWDERDEDTWIDRL